MRFLATAAKDHQSYYLVILTHKLLWIPYSQIAILSGLDQQELSKLHTYITKKIAILY